MVVIDPDVCIDCGVCVIECPAKAIQSDTQPGAEKWVNLNRELSQKWPVIDQPKAPLADADSWKEKKGCRLAFLKKEP